MFKMLVKLAVLAAVVGVVSIAVFGFYVKSQVDSGQLQARAERKVGERLGRRVSLGTVHVDWSGHVVAEGLRVAAASGSADQLTVQRVEASIPVMALLRGENQVSRITVTGPALTVSRSGGKTDLDDVLARLAAGPAGATPSLELTLHGGALTVDANGRRTKLEDLDATVTPGAGGQLAVEVTAKAGEVGLAATGTLDPAKGLFEAKRMSGTARGHTLELEDARLGVAGGAFTADLPRFRADGTAGSARVSLADAKLSGSLDIKSLPLPAHADVKACSVTAKLAGTLERPELTGTLGIDAYGVHAEPRVQLVGLPGTPRLVVEPTDIVVRGAKLSVSGEATELFERPALSAKLAGAGIALEPFLDYLPPKARGLKPRLVGDVTLVALRSGEGWRFTGEAHPRSGGLALPGGELSIQDGGTVTLEGTGVRVSKLPLVFGGNTAVVGARVQPEGDTITLEDLTVGTPLAHLAGRGVVRTASNLDIEQMTLKGDVDLGPVSHGAASGTATVDLRVKGDASSPSVSGRVTSPGLVVRGTTLSHVSANIEGTAAKMRLTGIQAGALGGQLTGEVELAGGEPTFDLTLSGAHPGAPIGALSAHLKGAGAGSALQAGGHATASGVTVDGSHAPGLESARKSLKGGGMAATALAMFAGDAKLKGLGAGGAQQAAFWSQVIQEVSRPHDLGRVEAEVSVQGDQAQLSPITGQNIAGRATVGLGSGSLSGHLDHIRLGTVEVHDVTLSGSVSSPSPRFDPAKLTLSGKTAPAGLADATGLSTKPADLVRKQVDRATGGKLGALIPGGNKGSSPTGKVGGFLKGMFGR